MPREVDRPEVQRLVAQGAQLIEVLSRNEYEEQHLPGALSFPLARIDPDVREQLDPTLPVVVYCWDSA